MLAAHIHILAPIAPVLALQCAALACSYIHMLGPAARTRIRVPPNFPVGILYGFGGIRYVELKSCRGLHQKEIEGRDKACIGLTWITLVWMQSPGS